MNIIQNEKFKNININKKTLKLVFIISLLLILLGVIFRLFENNTGNLKWDDKYSDINLEYVSQTNVKLGIVLSQKDKIKDLKFKTTCGNLKNNNLEIDWDLSDSIGKCKISVSYKWKKIDKTYTVISNVKDNDDLSLTSEESTLFKSDDLDGDGLSNDEENKYGTNPSLEDSDMDGISDYDEIYKYKTDPSKKDSDSDGLNDYDEIEFGLDPLKKDSKNDGILDSNREITYKYNSSDVDLSIKGTGNIASTVVDVTNDTQISNKTGMINKLFSFYTDGKLISANISIPYTEDELKKYELNEDDLSIYYYNSDKATYDEVQTTINKEKKNLTATINHFSSYVIGDKKKINKKVGNQVLFILDNSWSLYTKEQYEKITNLKYTQSVEMPGYDATGIRFKVTKNLINNLSNKNFKFGLSEYRSDYVNVAKMGTSNNDVKSKLDTMFGKFYTKKQGTNTGNALYRGIDDFINNNDNKYIVILTDGLDEKLHYSVNKIVTKALKNNVKICSVGIGMSEKNEYLSNISNSTGCSFYSSSESKGLNELFQNVESAINDNLVDLNNDSKTDGVLLADSGFIVNKNGFSFANYGSNLSTGGHCFGMATFAQLYYSKDLPLTASKKTARNETSYAYNLKNTYFSKYDNLYNYKLKTNALKYSFGFDLFNEKKPSNLYFINNDKIQYNKKYRDQITKSKLYNFVTGEAKLSKKEQIKKYGTTYSKYETIQFNEDKMQTSSIKNSDKQLFNAIYSGFIRQYDTEYYSSGSDLGTWLRTVFKTEKIIYKNGSGFINILKTRLNNKEAPVIFSKFNSGLHAINAISLVQNIKNPNHYYIGVYDNNYPGEKRYVEIECNKKYCVTKSNKYYKNSNQVIRITASKEYDLKYYNK